MNDTDLRALNKWGAILLRVGVSEDYLSGKPGPCPWCGGKDRFVWDNKEGRGTFYCRGCGSGSGLEFVARVLGVEYKDAYIKIDQILGGNVPEEKSQPKPDPRKRLREIARQVKPITEGDPVSQYLKTRGFHLGAIPKALKYHPGFPYWEGNEVLDVFPAMVGLISDVNNKPVSYHVTFLKDGAKAPVSSPKKTMPGLRNIRGCTIRLWNEAGEKDVAVCEGIETGLALQRIYSCAVWACISADGLMGVELPETVKSVIVAGDNDSSYTGQAAAYMLAKRLVREGKEVKVIIPKNMGDDFADEFVRGNLSVSDDSAQDSAPAA